MVGLGSCVPLLSYVVLQILSRSLGCNIKDWAAFLVGCFLIFLDKGAAYRSPMSDRQHKH